jgi:hypothetical protein
VTEPIGTHNYFCFYCNICTGPVLEQQQFLRTYATADSIIPRYTHIVCEERKQAEKDIADRDRLILSLSGIVEMAELKMKYQAREIKSLQSAVTDIHAVVSVVTLKESDHAIENREVTFSRIFEHPYGSQSGQADEASSGDSNVQGEQSGQEDPRPVGGILHDVYKWPPIPKAYQLTPKAQISRCCE